MLKTKHVLFLGVAAAVLVMAVLNACGGSSSPSNSASSMATVSVSLSDPPTCSTSSGGAFNHVYVTITDVKIHQSASAGASDSGWVDLTPNLAASPKQVDLLALGGDGCILAELGSKTMIQPGTYQQIRIYLAPNSTSVTNNQCNGTANCVVYNNTIHTLNLSSESQTGIKIPSGQIAGGSFTVAAGEVRGLVIDFDGCASLVQQGNGQFRLKPVLHAGEASTSATAVTGQLVDSVTGVAVTSATGIVALEARDSNGVDRLVMQTTPDANGNFIFCPVPAGSFDLVAVVESTSGGAITSYSATITTGVQAGNAVGKIPMHAQPSLSTQPGIINGLVTTASASSAGIAEDVAVSALQTLTIGSTTTQFTIPLVDYLNTAILVETASSNSCPTGTDCGSYSLTLPAALPYVGTFSASGTTWMQAAGTSVAYSVDGIAYTPGSSGTATCSPSEQTVSVQTDGTSALALTSGLTVTAKNMAFTSCQ